MGLTLLKYKDINSLIDGGKLIIDGNVTIDDDVRICYPNLKELNNGMSEKPVYLGNGCVLQSGCIIYGGCKFEPGVRIGHYSVVLWDVEIGEGTFVVYHCGLEDNVKIGRECCMYMYSHLTKGAILEDYVFIGPNVQTANDYRMRYKRSGHGENLRGPLIKRGARIAVGSLILPGVTIGNNSVVGAGSVVTKNVPDNMIAYGVPAIIVAEVPKEDRI